MGIVWENCPNFLLAPHSHMENGDGIGCHRWQFSNFIQSVDGIIKF
jgi:hypothetical protein